MGKRVLLAAVVGLVLAGAGCEGKSPEVCAIEECYRLVSCVEECGGPVIQSGCCPCPKGSFDDIECPSAAGGS